MNTISDIITATYTTSKEADLVSKNLKKWLGCEAHYEVARLALGRSLVLHDAPQPAPDSKGSPLKGVQLFGSAAGTKYLWIALLGEQLRLYGHPKFTLDALQQLVRDHWHRGVHLLAEDWQQANEDEAQFIDLLIRRAAVPESFTAQITVTNGVALVAPQTPASEIACNNVIKKLKDIGIAAEIRDSAVGARLIRYRLFLSDSGDLSLLTNRIDELEFSLGVGSIQCYSANEPQTCFLEIPRKQTEWQAVTIEQFDSAANVFCASDMLLPASPGVDVVGNPIIFDLADAPHLLVGGTTGSGKSVCVNSLLLSLFLASRNRPIQFALIDPKQVEFSLWQDCGLLYADIATSISSAISLLDSLIEEMDSRYTQFAALGVKNLMEARDRGFAGGWIVLAVDELADLVMQGKSGKSAEEKLVQLAQKARSAGIHLILATQRPDAKTFSGLLRSNCPARIALKVQKSTESSIILDETGAESLLGKGDMLIKGVIPLTRAHGYKIESDDITKRLRASL